MTMTPAEIKALVERLDEAARVGHHHPAFATLPTEAATALPSFMDGGWRLVPVEPTPEMVAAVRAHLKRCAIFTSARDDIRGVWAHMLANAPLPTHPAVEGEAS